MLTLTDKAEAVLESLIAGSDTPQGGLRIAVDAGGCVGLIYRMELADAPADDDVTVTAGKARIFVTAGSADLLAGTLVDFVDGADGPGFTFANPNAGPRCACTRSFAA